MRIRTAVAAASLTALGLTLPGTALAAPAAHPGRSGDLGACSARVSLRAYDDELDKATFRGHQVSELSGLAYDGRTLLAVDDQSHLWGLSVHTGYGLRARVTSYRDLADEDGQPLDSEAIAVDRDGTRLVTSETEPSVRRYDRAGHLLSRLPVPDRFRVAPAGQAVENGTFEGLTLLPGDRSLVATMEAPLSADGTDADGNGLHRFLRWDRRGHGGFRVAAQYAFTVDKGLAISDVQAVSATRLLVLERGWKSGYGNTIRLYEADLAGADDVTGVDSLAGAHVRQVHRTLLADLVDCPTAGATNPGDQANPLLDNIEGMVLTGRHLPHGRQELLLVSDDNAGTDEVTRLYTLSVRL